MLESFDKGPRRNTALPVIRHCLAVFAQVLRNFPSVFLAAPEYFCSC